MKKLLVVLFLIAVSILTVNSTLYAGTFEGVREINVVSSFVSNFKVTFTVDKSTYEENNQIKTMDAKTFIENDRTFVPVRYLALALGVSEDGIEWNATTRAVIISKCDKSIGLTIDSNSAYVNGKLHYLDVAPVIRDDRTYLPARFVAEALGFSVDWDDDASTVIITLASGISRPGKLFIASVKDKLGFIDATGEFVIDPQFRSVSDFSEGLAMVTLDDEKNYLINEKGEMVIASDDFLIVDNFHDGLAQIKVPSLSGDCSPCNAGFIDINGEIVIKPIYCEVNAFSEGLAAVRLEDGGKWGYINTEGEMVISPQFNKANQFSDGLALVGVGSDHGGNGLYGFINQKGHLVINPQYDAATNFSEGKATAELIDNNGHSRCFVIDKTGKVIIESIPSLAKFSEGLAVVMEQPKVYRYINTAGEFINETKYINAHDFSEGLAAVRIGEKYGFIDKTGEVIIEPQFIFADKFIGGLAYVCDENGTGYIDKSGKFVFYSDSYQGK